MQNILKTVISRVKHNNMQLQSKKLECYTVAGAKMHRINSLKTNCKVLPDLK